MSVDIARLQIQIDSSGIIAAQSHLTSLGRRGAQVGSAMRRGLTLPIVAGMAASVRAFTTFDDKMTQSLAIMDGVSDSMRQNMERVALELSEELTVSAAEAAESYFFLASAGLDAQQSIAALPQVARFAQAGMFDMATATDLATDAQSALGLTVADATDNLENLTRVTDILVKANTLANATVSQFAETLTNESGAAMKTFNIDMEEGVAVLAAFADQGIKGNVAGTGFSRILRLMSAAAVNNKEAMNRLNIEFFDAEGSIRNMADIIGNLEDALRGMSDEQRTAELQALGFSARVQGVLLPLLGTSEAIREYEQGLREASGTTEEIAENQLQSLSAQFILLKNTIVNAGIEIGDTFVETFDIQALVGEFQSNIRDAIDWFSELPPEVRKGAFVMAGLLGAAGPVIGALALLSTALGAISLPVTAAVAAAAAGGVALVSNWETVEEYFTTGGGATMWRSLENIVSSTVEIMQTLWSAFGEDITEITGAAWGAVLLAVEATLGRIEFAVSATSNALRGDWEGLGDDLQRITETTWERVRRTTSSGMEQLVREFQESESVFLDVFGTTLPNIIWTGSKRLLGGVGSLFIDVETEMNEGAKQVTRTAEDIMKTAGAAIDMLGGRDSRVQEFIDSVEEAVAVTNELSTVAGRTMEERLAATMRIQAAMKQMREENKEEVVAMIKESDAAIQELISGVDVSVPDKLFPPGSLGQLNKEMQALRTEMLFLTDPGDLQEYTKRIEELEDKIRELRGETSSTNEITRDLGFTFSSAFEDAAMDVRNLNDLLGVAQGLMEDISRMILRRTVMEPLAEGVSGFLGGLNPKWGGGGATENVNDLIITNNGRVFKPSPRDTILALQNVDVAGGQTSKGGGTQISVNVINQSQSARAEVSQKEMPGGGVRLDIGIKDVVENLLDAGRLDKSLGRNFNLRRQAVRRS